MPIFRLVSLLVMLVVIGMTVYNLHERSRRGDASPAGQQYVERPASPASAKKNRKPAPDEDPEVRKQFLLRAEAILDRSTSIRGYEMPAYWRVLDWVESQSLADFQARSLPQFPFQDYLQRPNKHRGQAVRVALEVRQVTSYEVKDPQGKQHKLYEVWGVPTELDGWLYVVVTPELPRGFPIGKNLGVLTTAYGYFFKVQGYVPFDAKLNTKPQLAPMLIGRLTPVSTAAPPPKPVNPLTWIVLAVGGVILFVAIAGWIVAARRTTASRPAAEFGLPDTIDDTIPGDNKPAGVEHD